ncbi:hypothetical protein CEXT_295071 [Caerostris extrusa]|uniref:Uncharacterized protein n=1 Tax=Caerostris extrusa TaxID=172846 RepID=A0AAV4RPL9_CAEEX|nr:hypothetical protein CEXT_295071 [Caerostris extrusa]
MRLAELKNLNSKAHWEGMNGSLEQNADYCNKKNLGEIRERIAKTGYDFRFVSQTLANVPLYVYMEESLCKLESYSRKLREISTQMI